jgi:Domain of unknown function (DUF4258)
MSATLIRVQRLAKERKVRISAHGYTRLAKRGILFGDVMSGVTCAELLEDYPAYHIGPAVLVLQNDPFGRALHAVWGIEAGTDEPAVLITAYVPDPAEWSDDLRSRRQ